MSDNNAKLAEQARQQREHGTDPGTVRVKVARDTPVIVGDKVHEPGSTFTAPLAAVENAIGRGLVEKVEKGRRS